MSLVHQVKMALYQCVCTLHTPHTHTHTHARTHTHTHTHTLVNASFTIYTPIHVHKALCDICTTTPQSPPPSPPLPLPLPQPVGDLGSITSDSSGRASFQLVSQQLKVWDVIGRGMLVHSTGTPSTTSNRFGAMREVSPSIYGYVVS